jgi:membrane protein YdbS with pleckstrin-like domain
LQRDISNRSTWFMIAMLIISVNIMIPSIVIIMNNKRHNNMTYSYRNHFINNNMTSQ